MTKRLNHLLFRKRLLGRFGELHKRSDRRLVGRDVLRRRLAGWTEMLQVSVDRLDVAVCHSAKIEPWHRRAELATCEFNELVCRHVLYEEAHVRGICRTPRPAPAELVPGKPQLLVDFAGGSGIAGRVTVIAASDLHQIFPARGLS